jgi:hypothetical protein
MSKRMIDTKVWKSMQVASLNLRQRLLWMGLITTADDQGRGEAHPGLVRGKVFPLDDFTNEELAQDIDAICELGLIILYNKDDGMPLYQIVKWWEYQKPRWAWPSELPAPEGWKDQERFRQGNAVRCRNWPGCEDTPDDSGTTDAPDDGDNDATVGPRWDHGGTKAETAHPGTTSGSDSGSTNDNSSSAAAGEAEKPNPFKKYQQSVGMLNGGIANHLRDLERETEEFRMALPCGTPGADVCGSGWVCEAIDEMVRAGPTRMNVNYIVSIINRWRAQGFKSPFVKSGDNGRTERSAVDDPVPELSDDEKERFRRLRAQQEGGQDDDG